MALLAIVTARTDVRLPASRRFARRLACGVDRHPTIGRASSKAFPPRTGPALALAPAIFEQGRRDALAKGYDGIRVSGNAFWIGTEHWTAFCEYEQYLDRILAGRKMLVFCTYSLPESSAVDMLDVARAHHYNLARRNGDWEFPASPELWRARQEIKTLKGALDVLLKPFPGYESLTARERVALAQIVRGATSKEVARSLGISPRTVEFHRANLMRKLGAKNTADLLRRVLGE